MKNVSSEKTNLNWFEKVAPPLGPGIAVLTTLWKYYTNQVQAIIYNFVTSRSMNNMPGNPNILQANEMTLNEACLATSRTRVILQSKMTIA